MKLSLKTEYACRVLVQLAKRHGSGTLAHIEELATAESVPANYLVQILNELRHGGLIISRRGKQGGYALARTAAEITLHDIIQVVDAELLETSFSHDGESGAGVAAVWSEVGTSLENKLRLYTLESMLPQAGSQMYYI